MENKKMIIIAVGILFILSAVFLSLFSNKSGKEKKESAAEGEYKKISSEEAAEMMKREKNYIIADVRTKEEYNEGHIPNAVSVPLHTIGKGDIEELPDKNQKIMVYCRSGNRSRQASLRLIEKGYTDVIDFGGINSWTGEIER